MQLKKSCLISLPLWVSLVSPFALADENEELAQAMRQLDAVKSALLRAKQEAINEKRVIDKRAYFDHESAIADVEMMKRGIAYYLNPTRTQPREPEKWKTLTGEYHHLKP